MTRPRVSVIIPTYQSESRIGRTLTRLRQQTWSDFEVVVVNYGSTDNTAGVVRQAMAEDSRVRLVEQPNAVIAAARNTAIEHAQGEMIAFLDDDDLWHRQKLELQIARLNAVPGAAVVTCFSALVDRDGKLLGWRFGGVPEATWTPARCSSGTWSRAAASPLSSRRSRGRGWLRCVTPRPTDWILDPARTAARVLLRPANARGLPGVSGASRGATTEWPSMGGWCLRRRVDTTRQSATMNTAASSPRDLFGAACLCLTDEEYPVAWRYSPAHSGGRRGWFSPAPGGGA